MNADAALQHRAAQPTSVRDPWMTVPEMAEALRVSRMTIYRAIETGHLRHLPVGRNKRVRRSWFQQWVRNGAHTTRKAS